MAYLLPYNDVFGVKMGDI